MENLPDAITWNDLKDVWPDLENRMTSEALIFISNGKLYYGNAHMNGYFYAYAGNGQPIGMFSTDSSQKYSVFERAEKWIYFNDLISKPYLKFV